MKQPLIKFILYSEKRIDLLCLLKKEPKSLDEIKIELRENSNSIQPHVKKLKRSFLIFEKNRVLSLSDLGKAIVENLQELIDTAKVVEEHADYWKKQDLSAIPDNLQNRIKELGKYEILEPDAEHLFETPDFFRKNILISKEVMTFVSCFHPESPEIYANIAKNNAELTLCMTEIVADRLFTDFPKEAAGISRSKNSKLLICRKPVKLPSIVVTERFMTLKLLEGSGKLRDQMLLCCEEKALKWGKELFTYYMTLCEPLEEKEFSNIHG